MTAMDDFGSRQDAAASERAAYWFARLRADDCSERERRSFDAWLSENDVHRQEYDRLRLMWEELDGLKGQLQPVVVASRPSAAGRPWRGLSSFGWPQLAAVAVLLIAVGIGWFGVDGAAVQSYGTAKGAQRSITLPDGSVAQLGADTLLTVEMSANLRQVRLEKGEALFTVAHEERPFEVAAGNGVIRDIGTQFDVRRDERRVTVAVLKGAVEVRHGRRRCRRHALPVPGAAGLLLRKEAFGRFACRRKDRDRVAQRQAGFRRHPSGGRGARTEPVS